VQSFGRLSADFSASLVGRVDLRGVLRGESRVRRKGRRETVDDERDSPDPGSSTSSGDASHSTSVGWGQERRPGPPSRRQGHRQLRGTTEARRRHPSRPPTPGRCRRRPSYESHDLKRCAPKRARSSSPRRWAPLRPVLSEGLLARPPLPAGRLQHLLVLLLAHPLAPFLDEGPHGAGETSASPDRPMRATVPDRTMPPIRPCSASALTARFGERRSATSPADDWYLPSPQHGTSCHCPPENSCGASHGQPGRPRSRAGSPLSLLRLLARIRGRFSPR